MPEGGVQYVVGTPAQTPVLRPLRQPMYDSEFLATGGTTAIQLFSDHKRFTTAPAVAKTEVDTNMLDDGSLGTPLEFDLIGFVTELARGTTRSQHNDIYNKCVWKWFFGMNVPWIRLKMTKVPEGLAAAGSVSIDGNGAPAEQSIISNGWPVVTNFLNFTTPDKKARRVTSKETFRNEILPCTALALGSGASVKVTTFMLGLLYAAL